MTTHYSRRPGNIIVFDNPSIPQYDRLPGGTYVLKVSPEIGFYFEAIEPFPMPSKTYGDLSSNRDRIIRTFLDRPAATGVVLAGEKGSGKTLLAKAIANELLKQDIPTIVINSPFTGDQFATVIQRINQPACIFFDEFEKCYDKEHQQALLTLMDGVYPSQKLFMLTTNDLYRVDSHMQNRPGRVFYMLQFSGLDPNFIREYVEDNLLNKDNVDGAVFFACMFNSMNFDMLKALVEEMNRYNETATEAGKMLNVSAEFDGDATFKAELTIDGKEIPIWMMQNYQWCGNPLSGALAPLILTTEEPDGFFVDHYSEEYGEATGSWSGYLTQEERKSRDAWTKKQNASKTKCAQWLGIVFEPEHIENADPKNIIYKTERATLVLSKLYSSKKSYRDSDY